MGCAVLLAPLLSILGLSPTLGHGGLFKISSCLACGEEGFAESGVYSAFQVLRLDPLSILKMERGGPKAAM